MELVILGSGGCVSTPRACCSCRICAQAREKGFPYARTGCSLFIEGADILIDTPEDINTALNNARIQKVGHILYSHCDPDHTMGMRVIEQLRMDWLAVSEGKALQDPVEVASLPVILEDIRKLSTKYGSVMGYYESRGLVRTRGIRAFEVNDILVTGSGGCAGARGSVCDLLRWQKGDLRALRRKALSGIRQISGRRCADHRQYDRRRRPERWICAGGRESAEKRTVHAG